jgi:putative sporulation protein YtaF
MALILSALLYSLSSNLDNLVIGIAYGIKKINIGIIANLVIATITSMGTFLSMSLGIYISSFFPMSITNSFGAIIIILLGTYFLFQSILNIINNNKANEIALKNAKDMAEYAVKSDLDNSGDLNIKEASFVGLGLMFNNLGTGLAASITGVNINITVISTFIFSILIIILGKSIGNNILGTFCGRYAPLFSGILLITLGIIEFFN